MNEQMLSLLKQVIIKLDDPVIRCSTIGVSSLAVAGAWMWVKGVKRTTYDTITDLKKKAKAFNKHNYQQPTNTNSKGF